MIRQLKPNEFNQAINFANQIFFKNGENDFLKLQPKVYKHPKQFYINHYIYEMDNKIVGLFGSYPFKYQELMVLGIGTVCVDANFRNQGIMQKMFSFIDTSIAFEYDLLYLMGDKKRYEHFGFYKTGQKISFRIKESSFKDISYKKYLINSYQDSNQEINQEIFNLYKKNKKVKREQFNFYDALKTLSYDIYLIYDNVIVGYLVYERKNNVIKEIVTSQANLTDILINFIALLNVLDIYYEVSIDDENISLLYDLSDNYHISNLANFKIINYVKVIEKLLNKKTNLKKGLLTINIIDKINILIEVNDEVKVKKIPDQISYDLVVTEKEAHILLFDNKYFNDEKHQKSDLITSYFPLVLPVSITSIESF